MISSLILAGIMTGQLGPPPASTPDYNPYMWGSPIYQYKVLGLNPYTSGYDPILGYNPIYERPSVGYGGYYGSAYFFDGSGHVSGGYVAGNQVYGGGPSAPSRVRYPSRHRYGNGYGY